MKRGRKARWLAEYAGYRFFETLCGLFPAAVVYRAGAALGSLAWRLGPRLRSIVVKNLRVAHAGELSVADIHALAGEVFRHTGANLLSAVKTARLRPEQLGRVVTVEKRDLLDAAIARGRGLVLLVPHMGNWEILAQLPSLFVPGVMAGTHYRPLNNVYLNALIERRRARLGMRLFSKRSSPHALAAFLKQNGILGILADQRAGRSGFLASYYGRFTSCSPLPEVLAQRTGAAVLALSMRTTAAGRWLISFLPVEGPAHTPHCMRALEAATRRSPQDVFWFQDRWALSARAPWQAGCRPHPEADPAEAEKPYRVGHAGAPPVPPADARPDLVLVELPGEVVDPGCEARRLVDLLAGVSDADALPLDALVCPNPGPALRKACRRLAITLVSPPGPETA